MIALSIKNLMKTYPNGTHALKGISLDVKQGDFFALLGQNGAGKSTTIGIICSLVNKTSGQIFVFDHDLDKELSAAKSLIGIVPQEMNFGMFEKVSDGLINQAGYYGIPKHIAKVRMEKYLKEVGLWEMRHKPAFQLSGGMKRRYMIARALMNEPKLLILDEPTAGVDIELRHGLWKFLKELNDKGTTIILTTHYLEEAEHLCKNVAIIHNGEIIENSDMRTLVNQVHLQTMIMDLATPLNKPPVLNGYAVNLVDGITLEIEIKQDQTINDIFSLLSAQNILVSSVRSKTNRLEELFIRMISENNISSGEGA